MRDVMLRVLAGELASEQLPMVAAKALVEGQDTPALRELAGLSGSEYREARDLLAQAVDELDLCTPGDEEQAHWEMARRYAQQIASGVIEPVAGAHAIAWHAGFLMYPETLATFAHLADLWEDGLGDRAELEQEIIREAWAYVDVAVPGMTAEAERNKDRVARRVEVHIDAAVQHCHEELWYELGRIFEFGPYFGRNLAALRDFEMEIPRPFHLVWDNWNQSRHHIPEVEEIVRLLQEIEENDRERGWTERFTVSTD